MRMIRPHRSVALLVGLSATLLIACQVPSPPSTSVMIPTIDLGRQHGGRLSARIEAGLHTKYLRSDISTYRFRIFQNASQLYEFTTPHPQALFENVPSGSVTVKVMAFNGTTPLNEDGEDAEATTSIQAGETATITVHLYLGADPQSNLQGNVRVIDGYTLPTTATPPPVTIINQGRTDSEGAVDGNQATLLATGDQMHPDIAFNSSRNEYMLVWEDYRSGTADIYGIRVDRMGSPIGSEFEISTAGGDQTQPAIAYNAANNGFTVVWEDGAAGSKNIYAQVLNSVGGLATSPIAVETAAQDQTSPDIAAHPLTGDYMIVWEDFRNNSYYTIFGRKMDPEGYLLTSGSTSLIYYFSNSHRRPAIVANRLNDQWGVVYERSNDLYFNRITRNGLNGDTGAPKLVSSATNQQQYPTIAADSAGNYVLAWSDLRNSGNEDIYSQRISSSGTLLETTAADNVALSTGSVAEQNPALAYNNRIGQYMVAWQNYVSISDSSISLLHVGLTNTPVGAAFAASTVATYQAGPAIAMNTGEDEGLVAWYDKRNGNYDIYVQRVR